MHDFDGTDCWPVEAPIEEALGNAEQALDRGDGLRGTGFWPAVARVKTDTDLVERYADRIGSIDQRAFANWALLTVPFWAGTTLALLGLGAGLVLVGLSYGLSDFAAVVVFYLGFGALVTTTHGLAHLVVGWLVGIRFTAWFIGRISRPQPGVKVDYSTYLRVPAMRRVWMHAAGPVVTKLVPFALIGGAVAAGLPAWAVWLLPIIGVATIVTDITWSTKSSDWKKVAREMRFAQTDRSG